MQLKPRYIVLALFLCATVIAFLNREAMGDSFERFAQDSMEASLPDDPEFGRKPSLSDCKDDVAECLRLVLIDYSSSKIEWDLEELHRGAYKFDGDEYRRVYFLSVHVNAKNRMGAYTGYKWWTFAWEDEELLGHSTNGGVTWTMLD